MTAVTVGMLCLSLGMLLGGILESKLQSRQAAKLRALWEAKPPPFTRPKWMTNLRPQPGTAGWTIAASLNGIGCLGHCASDEPVFVLCARDKIASTLVRDWAALLERLEGHHQEKVEGARAIADNMDHWRALHGGGKLPD